MSPVGGSRHYQGAGLGQIGIWACPTCGEDNEGPMPQGCIHCGAGKPVVAPPPPPTPPVPRVSERTPDDPTYDDRRVEQGDVADHWARQHVDVSIAEAYRAGYIAGLRAARAAQEPLPQDVPPVPDAKTYRTLVAALAHFRDQILLGTPEEVTSGEWLTAEEATTVIQQLQEQLHA
jgi:hypothetical protein